MSQHLHCCWLTALILFQLHSLSSDKLGSFTSLISIVFQCKAVLLKIGFFPRATPLFITFLIAAYSELASLNLELIVQVPVQQLEANLTF